MSKVVVFECPRVSLLYHDILLVIHLNLTTVMQSAPLCLTTVMSFAPSGRHISAVFVLSIRITTKLYLVHSDTFKAGKYRIYYDTMPDQTA